MRTVETIGAIIGGLFVVLLVTNLKDILRFIKISSM